MRPTLCVEKLRVCQGTSVPWTRLCPGMPGTRVDTDLKRIDFLSMFGGQQGDRGGGGERAGATQLVVARFDAPPTAVAYTPPTEVAS
jgi:hypothetical protein